MLTYNHPFLHNLILFLFLCLTGEFTALLAMSSPIQKRHLTWLAESCSQPLDNSGSYGLKIRLSQSYLDLSGLSVNQMSPILLVRAESQREHP